MFEYLLVSSRVYVVNSKNVNTGPPSLGSNASRVAVITLAFTENRLRTDVYKYVQTLMARNELCKCPAPNTSEKNNSAT